MDSPKIAPISTNSISNPPYFGQIVTIYGYQANDFSWRAILKRSIYHTSGLIIKVNNKRYILTTGKKLLGCKQIAMYHSYFCEGNPVMRNDLHIIFQSIELNITILGTINCNEFDISKSEIISGYYNPNIKCPAYDFNKNTFIIQTTKSTYRTIIMKMDMVSETVNYHVDIYNTKFIESSIDNSSYLPSNYIYKYTIDLDPKNVLLGICGACIFNKKHKLIGMIISYSDGIIDVLPMSTLIKIVNDYVHYIHTPDVYNGLLSLPFQYHISNSQCIVSETQLIRSEKKYIKKNDIILSINNAILLVENNIALVHDITCKENIPLDIYVRLNSRADIPLVFGIMRKTKAITIDIYTVPTFHDLLLSVNKYFYPKCSIPHINVNGLIITQLTHELLDVMAINGKNLTNTVIEEYLDCQDLNRTWRILLIIDCINNSLIEKYDLPCLDNTDNVIYCPIIRRINNKSVVTLAELDVIINIGQSISFKIEHIDKSSIIVVDQN